jgi:hypothetical protein
MSLMLPFDRVLWVTATVRSATAVRGAATTVVSRQGMFIAAIVGSVAYVALVIMRLICLEVVEGLCPARGHRSMVAVARIKAIVDMAIKAVGAVEPGAGSDEHPARKPIRPIVTVGRAIIRSIVEVAVGAYRRHSNVDGNLGWGQGCAA